MHLAILHYHLNRGGVTQVILNHLRALAGQGDATIEQVVLFYGGQKRGWPEPVYASPPPFQLRMVEIDELNYDAAPVVNSNLLAGRLRQALDEVGARPENTLLHVHNHALGKNASLPGALAALAVQGYRQLLQIHDFVEDLRPLNYQHLVCALGEADNAELAAQLYPQGSGVHYAVLNQRDRHLLLEAGVAVNRLHTLHNPVAVFDAPQNPYTVRAEVVTRLGIGEHAALVVYPVRGIRRKNLGEMLLISALDRRCAMYAVTLPPLNPVELASFEAWQRHAQSLRLACRFGLDGAVGVPFSHIVSAADSLLTTSVAEGFGMVFLEAWLADRMLIGRNLPEITTDFVDAGLCLDHLYDRLEVPRTLVNERAWRRDLGAAYRSVCAAYGQVPLTAERVEAQLDEIAAEPAIDFASLSVPLQRELIALVSRSPAAAEEILNANPLLELSLRVDSKSQRDRIRQNAEAARDGFSLDAIGRRIVDLYEIVFRSPVDGQLTALSRSETILDRFLDVRRLHPLRVDRQAED